MTTSMARKIEAGRRFITAVETVADAHSPRLVTSSERRAEDTNFEKFASGFFEEKARGEIAKNQTHQRKRKDADAATTS